MSTANPYQPPTSNVDAAPQVQPGNSQVPFAIVDTMRQTKPWATFLGVLGFIGSGLMVLAGLIIFLAGSSLGNSGLPATIGLLYIPFGALYVVPSLFLYRYGATIGRFMVRGDIDTLGEALVHQKSLWRFMGILTVVILVLYGLILVGGMVFGALGAFGRH